MDKASIAVMEASSISSLAGRAIVQCTANDRRNGFLGTHCIAAFQVILFALHNFVQVRIRTGFQASSPKTLRWTLGSAAFFEYPVPRHLLSRSGICREVPIVARTSIGRWASWQRGTRGPELHFAKHAAGRQRRDWKASLRYAGDRPQRGDVVELTQTLLRARCCLS